MKTGVRSQKSGVTPVSNAGSCPANRTHRRAPSTFLGGGEKVAAARMMGGAANADARNPSPQPSPLLRGREREPERVAVPKPCHRVAFRNGRNGVSSQRGERGSATILVLALVAIMMVFLTTNQRVLYNLKREVRLVEQQQLKKFQPPPAKPAAPPVRP